MRQSRTRFNHAKSEELCLLFVSCTIGSTSNHNAHLGIASPRLVHPMRCTWHSHSPCLWTADIQWQLPYIVCITRMWNTITTSSLNTNSTLLGNNTLRSMEDCEVLISVNPAAACRSVENLDQIFVPVTLISFSHIDRAGQRFVLYMLI